MKASDPTALTQRHRQLVHSEFMKVVSHVQRDSGDWISNTLMLEGHSVAFKYKRKQRYQSLKGARVNLTYYADVESVAGFEVEVMKVVRIKRS
ncbi:MULTISPECIES: hypothetical protein [Ferrimonas]|uniref:hypothetical protein n=1 Tax=Ferrimonas TaxID=44011 RepID=UPI000488E4BA|nr:MULTISPECIES: hypothetical protein [Ferrimonas]USD38896.1 hypothetical protein J8Z22_07280 [Ferrimonas sp. SCSIO 43195]